MAYYLDDSGDYVLTNIPSPPPGFLNVTEPSEDNPGRYIVGQHKFAVKSFPITNIFHRQIGSSDEIILGIFTVFLIAIFADLVQTILLRVVRDRHLFASNLVSAVLVDEITHLRNVWYHLWGKGSMPTKPDDISGATRRRIMASVVALFIAVLLFAAEVIAIILTQPATTMSTSSQYNLKGVQPAGTHSGMSKFIRRTSSERGCVPPFMVPQKQKRNFDLSACFKLSSLSVHADPEDVSDVIEIGSWFHRGGSDHNITFGDAFYIVQVRAEIFTNTDISSESNEVQAWKILFENRDTENLDHALYVQRRFIYAAVEWSCNQDFSEKACPEIVDDFDEQSEKVKRVIKLWRGKEEDVSEEVMGRVTRYRVRINAPFTAVNSGIRELMTSAAIEEVAGVAPYQSVIDDTTVQGLDGLLSEEGRVAGVLLVFVALLCFFVVLHILRCVFKPVSLGLVAMEQVKLDELIASAEGGSSGTGSVVCPSREDDKDEKNSANSSNSYLEESTIQVDIG